MVIVRRAPSDSALVQAMHPEESAWDIHAHLLASVLDTLNFANWQRQGKKSAKKPKPIPRPGVTDPDSETLGRDPLPVDEMAQWLGGAFAAAA